jgi:hypothetical protein
MKTIKLKDLNVTTGGFGWGGFYRAEALASAINGYPPVAPVAPAYPYAVPYAAPVYGGWGGGWGGGRGGFRR